MSKKYETQFDMMTKQPVGSLIVKLGIPTTISMLVTNLYNMADTYFVSKLGTSATGATGVVFGLMAILQATGFMFGHGAGSVISRKLGAKDIDEAKKYSSTSFYTALFAGCIIAILGLLFLSPFMRLLGSTDTILPYARKYAMFILIAAPAFVTSCVLNNILRYEGKAFFAMIGLTTGGVLNIGLDAWFMVGLGMGIEGAGIATGLSQIVSFTILLSMFLRGKTQTNFVWKNARFDAETLKEIIGTGLPSLARQGLGSISIMVLNNTAGIYGDAAIAGMSIVSRVCNFIFSVGLGIGQGFQPVAGFNYGAGKYSRVKKGFFFTAIVGTILMTIFSTVCYNVADSVIKIFRDDPEVIEVGTTALKAQCIGLFFVAFGVCNNMLFQSIGYKKNAFFLSTLRNGIVMIPILLLGNLLVGLLGIEVAQPISDFITFLICIPFTVKFFKNLPKDKVDEG